MKTLTVIIIIFSMSLILLRWWLDIRNDNKFIVLINTQVNAYNDWECGDTKENSCKIIFKITPQKTYQVHRIRYSQKNMAINIQQDGLEGWVIYDRTKMILVKKP